MRSCVPWNSCRFPSIGLGLLLAALGPAAHCAPPPAPAVSLHDGRLVYSADEQGQRIIDFSNCGYAGGDCEPPEAPVRAVVPRGGDDGCRIQAALDFVSSLPLNEHGLRGAVLLGPGEYRIAGQIRIAASGVVLRGVGAGGGGTQLTALGQDRRALVRIVGAADRQSLDPTPRQVVAERLAAGERKLPLDSTEELKPGDRVLIVRPSTLAWIKELGADAEGIGWRPGSRDLRWERTIERIVGSAVTLDAPLTTAIERRFGGATLTRIRWPGCVENSGVERLQLYSPSGGGNPQDEEHAWFGVTLDNARDCWVRGVQMRGFCGGAVAAWESTSRTTVEDCLSFQPISENAGDRRRTFFTQGQQNLFLRCWSEMGRRDFAVGHAAAGPNAFVNCRAERALGDSGPLESWASGVLYDNVRIDGAGLTLDNRWSSPVGAGWSAANCVLWQSQAATIRVMRPPGAQNWAVGFWAIPSGDGRFEGRSEFANPPSLFQAQLVERLGPDAAERVEPLGRDSDGATNPAVEEAAQLAKEAREPARGLFEAVRQNHELDTEQGLVEWEEVKEDHAIRKYSLSRWYGRLPLADEFVDEIDSRQELITPLPEEANEEEELAEELQAAQPADDAPPPWAARRPLELKNGWLTIDGRVVVGGRLSPQWWNGNARPDEAAAFGPAVTRFVPGRTGVGFTDDVAATAAAMQQRGLASLDHHYGLWYERRRDDHLMVRRSNGDCYGPYYEQPFARTGTGAAWDGLSRYDLTRFNPWYWNRLRAFADQCDDHGLVLLHQNYFQHNILEAAAHWVDCPWRSANNVNDTGFPEPPHFAGDKRMFLAPQFYDVSEMQTHRRELHRGYIRQCLDAFAGNRNVIQLTSAEYSGPREFVDFWLDTIVEWEAEHEEQALTALSAPKDVQDAILLDQQRTSAVDVIDIRYWANTEGGGLYAPPGGQNLAPRQHLRQTRLKPGGFAAVARAVREYRLLYPDKAVLYHAEENCPSVHDGWAVLMGGGSLADVKLAPELAAAAATMTPVPAKELPAGVWMLRAENGDALVYWEQSPAVGVRLPLKADAKYEVLAIDRETGVAAETALRHRGGEEFGGAANVRMQWFQRRN